MLTIRALTGGETYASRHLSSNDYYAENEKVIGQWMGRGAEMLGLEGSVTLEQFDAIRQGIDPATGEFLRPRHSADRFNGVGERTSTARSLYDFTVSAPKSVSLQALLDPRLVEAHQEAVKEMTREMESVAGTRVRQGGADENRVTGNLVVAAYRHDTSRELDPQLHTHLVAANLTYDGAEGRWKALQASDIYEQRGYLTEVYRNALAHSVRQLGYEIVDRFDEGRERGFEIQGVSEELLERFNQRSEQRDQAIATFRQEHGRMPSNGEIAVLVRETRSDKLQEISTAEVRAQQWERLGLGGRQQLEMLFGEAQRQGPRLRQEQAAPSLHYAREHIFERVSVAQDHELKREALQHGRGQIDLGELKAAALRDEHAGTVLKVGKEVATKESLQRERAMVAAINEGQGRYWRLGGSQELTVSDRLRPEQKQAVQVILDSRDLAVNLRGAAGTGKTATLQEIRRGIIEGGRSVLAVAPTRSAVEELEKVGFAGALTIERFLQDRQAQTRLRHQILIVDEAGMVSSRQMSQLLQVAGQQGAQLVFSGDTRQIQSVEAGDALRVLERESRLRSVSLHQVQRQTLADYRGAVEELRSDPARGFARLERMGAVQEVEWAERPQQVSQAYREAARQTNAQGQERSVLVVAPTHGEIRRITDAIRADREEAGELGASQLLTRYAPLHWTEAQKKDTRKYRAGQVLQFHKATKEVGKNEAVAVMGIDGDKLRVQRESGQLVTLTRRQAQAYSVFEKQEIAVGAGDRLLLEANGRERGFRATNGELVTVARVQGGHIELEDGRTVPAHYRQFAHGYAVTAHRSQGKTVDAVIVAGDRMGKELFYVAASRGRESLTIVTSDKEGLQAAIGVSGERQSATELARKVQEEMHTVHRLQEFTVGQPLASARDWLLRQAAVRGHQQERLRPVEPMLEQRQREVKQPTVQKKQERKQEQKIERGYGIGF